MGFRSKQARKAAGRILNTLPPTSSPADLPDRLAETSAQLQARFPWCSAQMAAEAALAAWSEIEGRRTRCYVDLEASTNHLVILVDPVAQTRRPIPTAVLVRMLGPRAAAA